MKLLTSVLLLTAGLAHAGQTVYKCTDGEKTNYSDEPCVGAKKIDVTPTQGLDKWTGKTSKGRDVQRKEWNTAMGTALQPLTGMTPEQFEIAGKRQQLSTDHQGKCNALDSRIPLQEKEAEQAQKNEKAQAEITLYQSRKMFKDLKC